MKRAILDYGTNSVKLVVCSVDRDRLTTLLDTERVARLGLSVVDNGRLTPEDVTRVLTATRELLTEADTVHPDSVDAVGTWALRACRNREALLAPLRDTFGVRMRLLTESEEAAAGFLAVRSEMGDGPLATLDVGGGSAELAFGADDLPERFASLPLGARELLQQVPINDPPTASEVEAIRGRVRDILHSTPPLPAGTTLVLIGGAATTLAGYAHALWDAPGDVVADRLDRTTLDRLVQKLARMTLAERRELPGAKSADRADVILHGAVILHEFLGHLDSGPARISLRGLQHGLLEAEKHGIMLDLDAPRVTLPEIEFPPLSRDDRDGEVLFALRRSDGAIWLQRKQHYPNQVFRLPGGGIDHGEASRTAVLRELAEETGLPDPRPIPVGRIRYNGPDSHPISWHSDLYLVDSGDHIPVTFDEKEQVDGWLAVPPEDLPGRVDRLEEIPGKLHTWGHFRAEGLRYLTEILKRFL